MSNRELLIKGADMVLPDSVLRGDLLINGQRIEQVIAETADGARGIETFNDLEVIDAVGMYLLPGMIDMHSDAIEKEISPRPGTFFPTNSSIYELEKRAAASGVTTIYHSLSLSGGLSFGIRSDVKVVEIIENINRNNHARSMIHHLVHLRYEISNLSGLDIVKKLLEKRMIHLLSFMDHTPGQGQYTIPGTFDKYMMKTYGDTREEAHSLVKKIKAWRSQVDVGALKEIADMALQQGVVVASHDDDTPDKIDKMLALGVSVSEFPINLDTARYAMSKNLHVAVGAPNAMRGSSHENNLRAIDAIRNGTADILCSDYYPPSMPAAVFKLAEEGIELPRAVRMVSLNPAQTLGLNQQGCIETGKQADLALIELYQGHPLVRKTLVGGKVVYQSEYKQK